MGGYVLSNGENYPPKRRNTMARMESKKNMGYYPTPSSVLEEVKKLLVFPDTFRALDTCCGNGDALECLRRDTGAETYGIELNTVRAEDARKKLNHVLSSDALYEVAITNSAFELMFINPPYDWSEGDKSKRLELAFLEHHKKYLSIGGVLIYVVPITSVQYIYKHFMKFKDLQIFSFPKGEYERFKQIVLIGQSVASIGPEQMDKNNALLKSVIEYAKMTDEICPFLPTTDQASDCKIRYHIKKCGVELKNFRSTRFVPEEAYELVSKSPLYKEFQRETEFSVQNTKLRPLMMPKVGHVGMLIAAGYANGLIVQDGKQLLIKGVIDSFRAEIEPEDGEKKNVITTETQYKIAINAIDLVNRKYLVIQN